MFFPLVYCLNSIIRYCAVQSFLHRLLVWFDQLEPLKNKAVHQNTDVSYFRCTAYGDHERVEAVALVVVGAPVSADQGERLKVQAQHADI